MRGGFRQFVFQKSVFLKHPNKRMDSLFWRGPLGHRNSKEKGKIGADKVCESQVLDRFCLGQVNTMSKTRRAKYAFLRQIRGILQSKSKGIGRLMDISPLY